MPPQHRVGLNDQQRRTPLPPRAGEQDPKEPIPWTERQACTPARQHGQLLTKGKVLKGNRSVSAAQQADRSEEYDKRRQHTVSCRVYSHRINRGAGRSSCGEAQLFREALAIHRKVLAPDDLALATSLNNLALVLGQEEKFEESEALYRESMAIRRKRLGNEHPFIAQSLNNIGMVYVRQRKHTEAEPLFKEALDINRKAVGTVHPVVGSNLNNLALVYLNTNRLPQAEEYFRQVLELDKKIKGDGSPGLAGVTQNLGVVLTRERKFAEAERYLREALAMKQKTFAADHWDVATTKNLLGACLTDEGRYAAAEPLLVESRAIIEKQFGPASDRTRVATTRVVTLYERWGKPGKAAEWRAKLPQPAAPTPAK